MAIKTYFTNIQEVLINLLGKAEEEICVAVAWLTNEDLFEQLCKSARMGVNVKVIILNDQLNMESSCNYKKLEAYGGELFWQEDQSSMLHHKFCVIDRKTVVTGSFNWTYKATLNRENITILENEVDTASTYLEEFYSLIPKVDDAVFFDNDYLDNCYFDTPEKRLDWFNSLSEKWQMELDNEATYLSTDNLDVIGFSTTEYNSFDEKIQGMLNLKIIDITDTDELSGITHLSNLKSLTIMNAGYGNKKIKDLEPLRNLINLVVLDLNNNEIEDITPLRKLKKLEKLNIKDNKIEKINCLSGHRKIKRLDISENFIQDISSLKKMFNLKDLRFNYNHIIDISALEQKIALKRLDFIGNFVEDINVLKECKNLETIACGNNKIESILPLMNLERLKYLQCLENPFPKEQINKFKSKSKAFVY